MNKLKRRILSFLSAAAVAVASIGIVPDIGGFVPSLTTEAGAEYVKVTAKSHLSGNDLIIYNKMKEKIEAVAAGETTDTVFTISPNDLLQHRYWSATELEVASTTTLNGNVISLTEEAMSALAAKVSFNLKAIQHALLADYPFDLYWFDKTAQTYVDTHYSMSVKQENDEYLIYFTDASTITFSLPVSKNYSASGNKNTYVTDPTQITAANTVRATAQDFVTANAGKSMFERVTAYKEAICDRVSYDTAAADNPSTANDNSWQAVWVFDGNSTTNVVCEGYAKAFKYLCDLDGGISCILVTGTMTGGTGAGGHMWNIVKMDDGENYLIDVTNCDSEGSTFSIGAYDKLLVAAPTSGTYSGKYTFSFKDLNNSDATVEYTYGDDTKSTFSESELTLSTTAYPATVSKSLVEGVSLSLGGEIGINFYLSVPDAFVAAGAKAVLSGAAGTDTHTLSAETAINDSTSPFNGCYKLTYRVNSTQMDSDITLTLTDSSDTVLNLYNSSSVQYAGNQCVYSVNNYLTAAKGAAGNSSNLNSLLDSMYNYGSYAAHFFDESIAVPSGLSALPTITAASLEADHKLDYDSGNVPSGIAIKGMTLVLNEKTSARLYFTADSISGHTFTVDGANVTPTAKDGMYYVEVANIPAHLLSKPHTAVIDGRTVNFTALTYVYRTLVNHSATPTDKNTELVKAIYAYSQAAEAYNANPNV